MIRRSSKNDSISMYSSGRSCFLPAAVAVIVLMIQLLTTTTTTTTTGVWAFTSSSLSSTTRTTTIATVPSQTHTPASSLGMAGGFEWEDPTAEGGMYGDSGVDNPYKNPELMKTIQDGGSLEDLNSSTTTAIDPARLLGPRLQGTNLYLVGMMGSGKSSVGDTLARRMGSYKFLDTDNIIEKATKMKITEIFASEGEDGFRDVESQVLDTVHSYVRCVISTGGGLVCKTNNWAKLQTGIVIWLDVSPELIYERIRHEAADRPLLQTEDPLQTLTDLLDERTAKYTQADVRVEITDPTMDEDSVVSKIVYDLHNHIDENPPAWKIAKQRDDEQQQS